MRLDSVEIVGFKSFCDRQELSFKGGVTGIVGPNGCGKSNISDAINWVLGEQSVKSLRGTSMEDVIFNGSSSRQPLNVAEVNLKVSGLNGNSPDGAPDCTVTRRLYRNGESEYLMNGRICRLRDIHELFMDTGLGSKAYSIIEQGKIGQILSSKPADRRAIIEEAAGITKYKARRRQTQLKLEAAQQNLLRVNDIVNEVEKQLESLKRQAAKARRWRAVKEQMQGVERVLFGRRFLDTTERARTLEERHAAEAGREQAASLALATEEAQLEARRHALYELEAQLETARARTSELTLAVDRHEGRGGYCRQQIAETETRGREALREEEELQGRVAPLTEAMGARRAEEERMRQELLAAESELQAAEAAVSAAAGREAEQEAALEGGRDAQIALMGRIATLQNSRAATGGNAERAAADLLKLAGELAELARERTRVESAREAARTQGAQAESLVADLVRSRDEARERAEQARHRASELGGEVETLQSECYGLAGRRASLEEMVATHSAFDEGVRAVLERPEGLDVLGVVADAVETGPDHERAVEAFLGDRLQAVLVPDVEQARRGVRWLQSSGAGRTAFLPLASSRTPGGFGSLREIAHQEPKALALLSDFYRVSGPHAEAIRTALPDALVVATLEDAFDVASRQGPVPLVTLDGETLRDGLVEGGRGGKGLLAPRREVKEVAGRHEVAEARLVAARAALAEVTALGATAEAEARGFEEGMHSAEKDLVAVRHEIQTADEEATRLLRKASILDTERRQAEEERGTAAVRLAEIDQALASAEADREEGHRRLGDVGGLLAEARAASEAVRVRSASAPSRARTTPAGSRPTSPTSSSGSGPPARAVRRRPRASSSWRRSSARSSGSWRSRCSSATARPARAPSPRSGCARSGTSSRAASRASRSAGASGTCCATRSPRWTWSAPAPGPTSTTSRASASRRWAPRRRRRLRR
jgi:chromosome segregation protein